MSDSPHPQPDPHPYDHHPDPRAHPHQHAGPDDRHDPGRSAPVDPYPFIYSRDAFDARRYAAPGQPYAPARNKLPRAAALAAWAIVILVVGGGLISIIAQILHR